MAASTINNPGGYTLPVATIAVASTSGFVTTGGIIEVFVTGTGPVAVTYTGISGNTFTGCSGGTGSVANSATVTQSVDQGTSNGYTKPMEPLRSAASGMIGNPSTTSGLYAYLSSLFSTHGKDLSPTYNIEYLMSLAGIGGGGGTTTKTYLMQAYESGGGCTGNVRRIWIATGSSPDLTGAQYTGARCTPSGTFSSFSVLASW